VTATETPIPTPTEPRPPEPPDATDSPNAAEAPPRVALGSSGGGVRGLRRTLTAIVCVQAIFLLYRALFTLSPEPYVIAFFGVEVVAALALFLLLLPALTTDSAAGHAPLPPPDDAAQPPTVDVIVPAVDTSEAAVRRTALAAIRLHGRSSTILIGDTPATALLADELGCAFESAVGAGWIETLNTLLPKLSGTLVAVFEPGQIPHIDFLTRLTPIFEEPTTAMVQARLSVAPAEAAAAPLDPDQEPGAKRPLALFEERDRRNAVPWLGTNALFRRSALVDSGGFAPGPAPQTTSARLQAAGWRTRYHPQVLSSALEEGEQAVAKCGSRPWAALSALLTLRLSLAQRLSLVGDLLAFAPSFAGTLYVATPLVLITAGLSPVRRIDPPLALFWAAAVLSTVAEYRLLQLRTPNLSRIVRLSRGVVLAPLWALTRRVPGATPELLSVALSLALAAGLWSAAAWTGLDLLYGVDGRRFGWTVFGLWAGASAAVAWRIHLQALARSANASRSRDPQEIPLEYRAAPAEGGDPGAEDESETRMAEARDVGGQGVGILAHEELELGGRYQLSLKVFGRALEVAAIVVYEEPGGADGEWRYFLRPDRTGRDALARLARALEARRRREIRTTAIDRARKVVRRPAKRRAPRFPFELPVTIDAPELGTIHGTTLNVSTTGAALRVDRELPEGLEVELRFVHAELPASLRARVVACRAIEEEGAFRVGVDLASPCATLARLAGPDDAPLFLDPWDVDHDAMTQRGLRASDAGAERRSDDEAGRVSDDGVAEGPPAEGEGAAPDEDSEEGEKSGGGLARESDRATAPALPDAEQGAIEANTAEPQLQSGPAPDPPEEPPPEHEPDAPADAPDDPSIEEMLEAIEPSDAAAPDRVDQEDSP